MVLWVNWVVVDLLVLVGLLVMLDRLVFLDPLENKVSWVFMSVHDNVLMLTFV